MMSSTPWSTSRTQARSLERCSTSTVDRTQAGGNRNRSPRRFPERGRWMAAPIAEAVHRLPPCRMSLASERGAGSELLYVHASIGVAATAAGAFIALCVFATKVLTGAAESFGVGCLLRLRSVLMQSAAMLVGI